MSTATLLLKPAETIAPVVTLSATPVPIPDGIIYRANDQFWQISEGQAVSVDMPEAPSPCQDGGIPSTDGAYCLENGEAGLYPTTTELASGKIYPLDIYPDYAICCATWWEGNPGYLLVEVQPGLAMVGMGYQAILAYLKSDGTGLTLIGHEPTSTGPFALAAGGQQIAFEEAGVPWLFTWGRGTYRLDLPAYQFPELDEAYFGWPSWSPSNRKLVWTVMGSLHRKKISGFGVFDLENKISKLIYPYEVSGPDTPIGVHGWSPDEKYITLDNGWVDGFWIISTDGTQSYHFAEYKDRMQVVWQPSMKYAIIVIGDGYDHFENWLVDLTAWDIYKLGLPSEARVVDWKES